MNEAIRCFDEGVAGEAGSQAAGQIDLATVMGMGFAPFQGGVMRYAETLGSRVITHELKKLEESFGMRFAAASGVSERSSNGGKAFVS